MFGISGDATLPDDIRINIGAADQTKRQPTAEPRICVVSDANALVAVHLQERATALVDQARSCCYANSPSLWSLVVYCILPNGQQPAGEIAGSSSASSSSYVCCRPDFTDLAGMAVLRQLYEQMNVPVWG